MRYWYDTEFHEDGSTIDLISIGIVCEDGREYYAVNADADWARIAQHEWLTENVVPHLPPAGSPEWRPHKVIAEDVADFLRPEAVHTWGSMGSRTPRCIYVDRPELWAWYGAYDHVALAQLWGPMIARPRWIPMWTNDLRQEQHRLGNPPVPEQVHGNHDALADARHNRVIHAALTEYARAHDRA
ncbi:Gp101 [Mycobacteroides abscessus subsp. abscessus]|nr:Gp101 [Mycobacteroides abscessus subsp. abscessus]